MIPKLPPIKKGKTSRIGAPKRKIPPTRRSALTPASGNRPAPPTLSRVTTPASKRFRARTQKKKTNDDWRNQKNLLDFLHSGDSQGGEDTSDSEEGFERMGDALYTAYSDTCDVEDSPKDIEQLQKLIEVTGPTLSYDDAGNVINKGPEIIPGTEMTQAQQNIYKAAMKGSSFFFTGAAGTGKSYTLRLIIDGLKEKYKRSESSVHVMAPTGCAAYNVNGVTIHSFAGIGKSMPTPAQYMKRMRDLKGKFVKSRWLSTRVIIIDEISMVGAEMFDFLEQVARMIKKSTKPFGGIQVILCGDFCQLSPVKSEYPFLSNAWNRTIQCGYELVENFRQNNDLAYAKILNEIRFGNISVEAIDILDECKRPFEERPRLAGKRPLNDADKTAEDDNGDNNEKASSPGDSKVDEIECTVLYPRNVDVNAENEKKLDALPGERVTIYAEDTITKKNVRGRLYDRTLSQTQFIDSILQKTERPPESVSLKVGAQVILTKNLSTGEGLVNGARGVVTAFYELADHKLPIVKFKCGQTMQMTRIPFEIRTGDEVVAVREQIPIILGFACTIHRSQGMTLDMVRMNLEGRMAPGQVYTALSRASSAEGLYIEAYDPSSIRADRDVIQFYKKMHGIC